MKKLSHHQYVYVALLIWLVASLSGMHGHYCFDGAEPPISVHFDMMAGHDADHDALNEMHVDVDNNPSQAIAIKIVKLDLPFLALALLLVFIWPIVCGQSNYFSKTPSSWLTVTGLRPPLRAPPKNLH